MTANGPFLADIREGSEKLVMFFGGAIGGFGKKETPFEFLRATHDEPYSKFFVRDMNQSQYQKGLEGLTSDVEGTVRFLKKKGARAKEMVCVGNCMGSFAAMYFGARLKAKAVHAFSPVSTIDTIERARYRDLRSPYLSFLLLFINTPKRTRDLNCLDQCQLEDTRFYLHYSAEYGPDRAHIERLKNKGSFTLLRYPGRDHYLVKRLRDDGSLLGIISETDPDKVGKLHRSAARRLK